MKKALIITYYWPPAGGPGVQRWLKFVKHLPKYGVEPIVYIPSNPTYPIVDKDLVKEIPQGITILKQPIFEPYALAQKIGNKESKTISSGIIPPSEKQNWKQRFLLWIRGNVFIPDARKYWIKPSVSFLTEVIQKEKIDTIITTGPPHSVHLIGLKLKEKLGVRWIADFRDPWTTIGYHKKLVLTNWAKRKHENLESLVLQNADQLMVTSLGTKKEFAQKTTTPIKVITNGFEPVEFANVVLDKEFSISHIGSLLSERNPLALWEALSELIVENKEFKKHFKLKLAGVVSETIIETLDGLGLKEYISVLGYVSHSEALQLQKQSQVLLLIEIDSTETQMIIPGKLFEYMQSERPILSVGPKSADFAELIIKTSTGSFFEYHEKTKIKAQISTYFEAYLQKQLIVKAVGIEKYTREALTAKLAEIIIQ